MTTIAYKDGILAYDSQTTCGDIIISLSADKKTTVKEVDFFICGSVAEIDYFTDLYFGSNCEHDLEVIAFVLDKGTLWLASTDEDRNLWKLKVNEPRAIGTGRQFAIGAMDCGYNAEQAVKLARDRDIYTGGAIRTFSIESMFPK